MVTGCRARGPARPGRVAASRVWRHFRPRVVSRLVVGERTVTTGPSGTVRRTRPPGSPTSMAASPNAEFHGSARWPWDPRIAVPTASPCVTLRSRSRTGAGRCGAPLNQTSRTMDRATSSPSSGTIPPMWSLSMWVTTATSTCWSLSANRVNRSRRSGQVSGGPPSTSSRHGSPRRRRHSTRMQSPIRAGSISMRIASAGTAVSLRRRSGHIPAETGGPWQHFRRMSG